MEKSKESVRLKLTLVKAVINNHIFTKHDIKSTLIKLN